MSCRSIRVAVSEKLINDINFLLCLTFSTSISVKHMMVKFLPKLPFIYYSSTPYHIQILAAILFL